MKKESELSTSLHLLSGTDGDAKVQMKDPPQIGLSEEDISTAKLVAANVSRDCKTRRDIDGGYAWVILGASFTLNVFMSGQFGTLGIYLVEYLHYFGGNKAPITYIGACQMFVGYFLGVFNGALMKRYGCRVVTAVSSLMVCISYLISAFIPNLWVLYIFFGVIAGVGFLNFYLVAIVVIQQYFDKKRAFATGISTSGLSVGVFMWAPFTRWLIERYSWQGALIIEGGIFLNGLVCAALLRPQEKPTRKVLLDNDDDDDDNSSTESGRQNWFGRCWPFTTYQFVPFFCFLVGYFCIQLGHMTMYTYTPIKGSIIQMPKAKTSFLVSLMGITGIFARPVIGFVGDLKCVNRTVLIGISAIAVGTCCLVSTAFLEFIPLAVISCTFGFFASGYMALYGAALVDIVGLYNIEVTGGTLMLSKGTANLVLHTMSGWLMDMTGNVNVPFMVFGGAQVIGGICIIPIPWLQRALKRRAFTKRERVRTITVTTTVGDAEDDSSFTST